MSFESSDIPLSPEESELRGIYDAANILALRTISDFEPLGAIDTVDLISNPNFSAPDEYEALLQARMLASIGVPRINPNEVLKGVIPSGEEIFIYDDAVSRHVQLTRDGDKPPVHLQIVYALDSSKQKIGGLKMLQLQSDAEASATIDVYKRPALEAQATKNLSDKFGIDVEFIRKSGLTLEDMQGFLEASEYLESTPVKLPDMSKIEPLRDSLVRTIMHPPKRPYSPKGFKTVSAEYLESLNKLLNDPEIDDTTRGMLATNEQMVRLAKISQSLPERLKRVDKKQAISSALWATALTGLGTLYGYVGETVPKESLDLKLNTLGGFIAGVALSGIYLVPSVGNYLSGRKYVKQIETDIRKGGAVDAQIHAEFGYINSNNRVEHL